MASRFLGVIGLVRPSVNLRGFRVLVKLENLNGAFPHRFSLEHFFDRNALDVRGLYSMQPVYYVSQFINIIPHYESFSEDGVILNCNVNPSAAFETS